MVTGKETKMDFPLYQEAICHLLSGVAITLADRLFSKNAKRHTKERVDRKLEQVTALNFLAEAEQREDRGEVRTGRDYLEAVVRARDYFRQTGRKAGGYGGRSVAEGMAEFFRHWKDHERINNLRLGKKLGAAFGIEFVADGIVAVAQIMGGQFNGLMALWESLYQGPSLFVGFLAGRGLLGMKDVFRSKEEKELDEMADELTRDGKLLEIVRDYSPTEQIEPAIEEPTADAAGKEVENGIGEAIVKTAGEFSNGFTKGVDEIKGRVLETLHKRVEEKEKRRKELKKKYEEY
jgi:hypothetical protein